MSAKVPAYTPPEALLGDDVFWFPNGSLADRPQAAKVVEVGRDALTLAIYQPMADRLVVRDSVRHADDPRPKLDEVFLAGVWCGREDYFSRPAAEVPEVMKAGAGSHEAERGIRERARKEQAEAKKQAAAVA